MIFLILYIIGVVLWFTCVILQRNIINQQKELISTQAEIIRKQEIKQRLSDIIIKEQRELTELQKQYIEEYIANDSVSVAYSQTFKEDRK